MPARDSENLHFVIVNGCNDRSVIEFINAIHRLVGKFLRWQILKRNVFLYVALKNYNWTHIKAIVITYNTI